MNQRNTVQKNIGATTWAGIELPHYCLGQVEYRHQSADQSPSKTPREKVTMELPGWPGATCRHLIATITQFTTPQGRRMYRVWYYPTDSKLGTYSKPEAARAAVLSRIVDTLGCRKAGAIPSRELQGAGAPVAIELLGWPLPSLQTKTSWQQCPAAVRMEYQV